MAAVAACSGSPVTRCIVRPQEGSLCLATVICDVFLCACCHNRVRQRLLLREQFGEELEPRLAPWMPSFIIHSNPFWLGALLWVSHCSSSTLGSLRPRGGKIHLGDGEWQTVGDDESILALEITLNPLLIVQDFEIAQTVSWLLPNTPLKENTLGASLYAELKSSSVYVPIFPLFSRLIFAIPNPLPC